MVSYGLGFSHSDINEKCSKMTRKKKSKKDLKSLWRRMKPDTTVDTVLTISSDQASKPQTKILGGRYP